MNRRSLFKLGIAAAAAAPVAAVGRAVGAEVARGYFVFDHHIPADVVARINKELFSKELYATRITVPMCFYKHSRKVTIASMMAQQ